MNPTKMLTVICCTYNHELYIKDALEGFVNQDTEFGYEVWVADDCSTDNTRAIIEDYAKKYPEIIKPILREKNLGIPQNALSLRPLLDTKYVAICEGDDYWCNPNFVQKGIEVLEENSDCTIFGGNTIYYYHEKNQKKKLVRDTLPRPENNRFCLENNLYLHNSARILRNSYPLPIGDLYIYHIFLSLGYCYYYDEVVSVYNITGKGVWSKLSAKEQEKELCAMYYALNKYFNYKYDDYYTSRLPEKLKRYKKIFGTKLGWMIFLKLKRAPLNLEIKF